MSNDGVHRTVDSGIRCVAGALVVLVGILYALVPSTPVHRKRELEDMVGTNRKICFVAYRVGDFR